MKRIILIIGLVFVCSLVSYSKPAAKFQTAPDPIVINRLVTVPSTGTESVWQLSSRSSIRLTVTWIRGWDLSWQPFVTAVNNQTGSWVFEQGTVGLRDTTWQSVVGTAINIERCIVPAGRIIRWKRP